MTVRKSQVVKESEVALLHAMERVQVALLRRAKGRGKAPRD